MFLLPWHLEFPDVNDYFNSAIHTGPGKDNLKLKTKDDIDRHQKVSKRNQQITFIMMRDISTHAWPELVKMHVGIKTKDDIEGKF